MTEPICLSSPFDAAECEIEPVTLENLRRDAEEWVYAEAHCSDSRSRVMRRLPDIETAVGTFTDLAADASNHVYHLSSMYRLMRVRFPCCSVTPVPLASTWKPGTVMYSLDQRVLYRLERVDPPGILVLSRLHMFDVPRFLTESIIDESRCLVALYADYAYVLK